MGRLRPLIVVLIGLLLLLLVLAKVNLRGTLETLETADYWYLVPAILFLLLSLALKTFRWRYLLGPARRAGAGSLFLAVLVGYFGNQVLILESGEILRALVLGEREDLSKSAILGTLAVEKLLDILTLAFFLFTLMWFLPLPPWVTRVGFSTAILLALGLILAFGLIYNNQRATEIMVSTLKRVTPSWAQGMGRRFDLFIEGLRALERKGEASIAFLLGFPFWALIAVSFYFTGLAAHIDLPPQSYALTVVLVALGALVLTPGGMGTLELFGTGSLALMSVDSGRAFAFVILVRLVRLLPITLGYIIFTKEGFGLRSLRGPRSSTPSK